MELDIVRIESLCREREEKLVDAYFGGLVEETAHQRPEFIGKYTLDLPFKIESEYKDFMDCLVKILFPTDESITAEINIEDNKMSELIIDDDREVIVQAYKKLPAGNAHGFSGGVDGRVYLEQDVWGGLMAVFKEYN